MTKRIQTTNIDAFLYQKYRRHLIHAENEERYILLSTLFGSHIEDGHKTIKDYSNFTMYDAASELKLRTSMMRSHNTSKIRNHFKEQKDKENELLRKLKESKQ